MPQGVSTRWWPTPQQLLILQDMYRAGVRNPNAFQIQQITSHLSYYGKIEGKNVFYWFQNHKARERQKLRKRMLKQLQNQYQLDRLAPTILQLRQQNQNNFFLPHHKHNGENEAGNFMYKMAITSYEERINKTAADGGSENQEWFVLQINPERVCRGPLKTLDLFPVSKSSLNHFEAEEKDRVASSSTDNSAIPHSSKCITRASSDLCIA